VRAVTDTKVLLSGLRWHGTPHKLLEEIRAGALTVLDELSEVIRRPKFQTVLARSGIDPEKVPMPASPSSMWLLPSPGS
jgi:predicted nucleic acid-binding protein